MLPGFSEGSARPQTSVTHTKDRDSWDKPRRRKSHCEQKLRRKAAAGSGVSPPARGRGTVGRDTAAPVSGGVAGRAAEGLKAPGSTGSSPNALLPPRARGGCLAPTPVSLQTAVNCGEGPPTPATLPGLDEQARGLILSSVPQSHCRMRPGERRTHSKGAVGSQLSGTPRDGQRRDKRQRTLGSPAPVPRKRQCPDRCLAVCLPVA